MVSRVQCIMGNVFFFYLNNTFGIFCSQILPFGCARSTSWSAGLGRIVWSIAPTASWTRISSSAEDSVSTCGWICHGHSIQPATSFTWSWNSVSFYPHHAWNWKGHFVTSHVCFTGHIPSIRDGTYVIVPLVSEFKKNCWGAKIVEQGQNRVKLCINSVPNACVGRYTLNVVTHCQGGRFTSPCVPDNDIYMLFNPWCKGKHKQI